MENSIFAAGSLGSNGDTPVLIETTGSGEDHVETSALQRL